VPLYARNGKLLLSDTGTALRGCCCEPPLIGFTYGGCVCLQEQDAGPPMPDSPDPDPTRPVEYQITDDTCCIDNTGPCPSRGHFAVYDDPASGTLFQGETVEAAATAALAQILFVYNAGESPFHLLGATVKSVEQFSSRGYHVEFSGIVCNGIFAYWAMDKIHYTQTITITGFPSLTLWRVV